MGVRETSINSTLLLRGCGIRYVFCWRMPHLALLCNCTILCLMKEPLELCYSQAARRSARFLSRYMIAISLRQALTSQQLAILSVIEHNPGLLIADLAERMVMDRATLVRPLKPLQQTGLVVTDPSGSGRSLILAVSRRGA